MKRIVGVLIFNFVVSFGFSQTSVDAAMSVEDRAIYSEVDEFANPFEGMSAFRMKLAQNLMAALPEVSNNIKELRTVISLVVEKDGSFSEFKIVRDPGYNLGNEVIRIMKLMPKWKAAMKNGKPVRSFYTFPITIKVS